MTKQEFSVLLRSTSRGLELPCKVQPRSSRNSFGGLYDGAVKVFLTAPPVDGKANAALCAFLAKAADLPKSAVSVASGETSRNKSVLFLGISADLLAEKLSSC